MNKKKINRITRRHHQTPLSKIKTVDDLFIRDDVNEMLRNFDKSKHEATDLIMVWRDKNGEIWYDATPESLQSDKVFMLESTKFDLLNV